MPEEKKTEIPQAEPLHEIITEPEPTPTEVPAFPEERFASEPAPEEVLVSPNVKPVPDHELKSTPPSTPSQTVTDPQLGNMVCVPGFGWLECQGPGEIIHDKIYTKVGTKSRA